MPKRIVSGVQPSGSIHLGNYYGAIAQHIEHQKDYQCFYFIADYHALTTVQDRGKLLDYTRDVAACYLALGLDPKKATFYRQSDLVETTELSWILSTITGMGLLERAHSYKDKVGKGIKPSMGLFTYPILMAADILIVQAELVPVGEDQVQHVEMTQDMAERFNGVFQTHLLKRPEAMLSKSPKVPGVDGQKMSKSYGNALDIFLPADQARKKIMSIKTDSQGVNDAKDPDTCLVFGLLKLMAKADEIREWEERYRKGPLGYGEVKTRLAAIFEETFASARKRYEELRKSPDEIDSILGDGAKRVKAEAEPFMTKVRSACGLRR